MTWDDSKALGRLRRAALSTACRHPQTQVTGAGVRPVRDAAKASSTKVLQRSRHALDLFDQDAAAPPRRSRPGRVV